MLAAIAGSGVGHEDADVLLRHMEGLRELALNAEGTLRAGPHRELFAVPFGDGCARLKRCMSDISDGERRFELVGCLGKSRLDRAFFISGPALTGAAIACDWLLKIAEQSLRRRLRLRLPLGFQQSERRRRCV